MQELMFFKTFKVLFERSKLSPDKADTMRAIWLEISKKHMWQISCGCHSPKNILWCSNRKSINCLRMCKNWLLRASPFVPCNRSRHHATLTPSSLRFKFLIYHFKTLHVTKPFHTSNYAMTASYAVLVLSFHSRSVAYECSAGLSKDF